MIPAQSESVFEKKHQRIPRDVREVFCHDNRFNFCLLFLCGIVTIFLLVAVASGSSCEHERERAYLGRVAAHERDLGSPAS